MMSEIEKQYFGGSYGFMASNIKSVNKVKPQPMSKEKLIKLTALRQKLIHNSKSKTDTKVQHQPASNLNNLNNKRIRLERISKIVHKTAPKPKPKAQPQSVQKVETKPITNLSVVKTKQKSLGR